MNNSQNNPMKNEGSRFGKHFGLFVTGAYEFVELLAFTLLTVFILTSFMCRHSVVKGPSMEKTLEDGQHLLISNLFYTPEQGDIIVFNDVRKDQKAMVKRVIAVGGQHVKVTESDVYVDGVKLEEDYVYLDASRPQEYHPCELTVPEGSLFVMGDHRNNSRDSTQFGVIDERSVLGKAWIRLSHFMFYR